MDTPPPLPQDQRKSFFQRAATTSLLAPLFALVVSGVLTNTGASVSGRIGGIISGLILLIGVGLGIVALFGIRRHGARGILVKALCGILIPLVLTALALPAVLKARELALQMSAGPVSLDRQLELILFEVKKKEGTMIDESTRLDHVEILPDHKLAYTYTVIDVAQADLAPDALEKHVRPTLIEYFKSSPDMRRLRGRNITFVYRYTDKNGEPLGELSLAPGDW